VILSGEVAMPTYSYRCEDLEPDARVAGRWAEGVGEMVKKIIKLRASFTFCALAFSAISFLGGCQTMKSFTQSSEFSEQGNQTKLPSKKPNKNLPIDYVESDSNSREIWFDTYNRFFYACKDTNNRYLMGNGLEAKSVKFLRSGNILVNYRVRYPSSTQYLDFATQPRGSFVGISGVDGIKFKGTVLVELSQSVEKVFFKYAYNQKVKGCVGDFSRLKKDFEIRREYEIAHAEAVKLARSKNKKMAPSLKQKQIETIPPEIALDQIQKKTDSYSTFIRGSVSDNEGVMTVLVNGVKAGVKADGSFASKVKLTFGTNNISVQAEDLSGNISEKQITIVREDFIPEETLADVDIPKKTTMNNPDGVGVVIGVESYQYVSPATFAYNDAEVFREYLADTLGYNKSKIKIATNSKATQAELNKLLGPNGWIARNVKASKSDVVVYFSGHGIPDAKTKKTGLLPFDVDPNYSIGLTLRDLYRTLGSLNARSVTVFLDTCFSGQGREKQTLLADTRGIQIVAKERNVPGNITVLSAATAGQVSGPIKAKEHGLFTYYLLKGLGGAADSDKNKKLTISELSKYVHLKVKEDAAIAGREQTPELQGDGGRVLVAW
jgi:hypothetical protein